MTIAGPRLAPLLAVLIIGFILGGAVSAPLALGSGILLALFLGNPWGALTKKTASKALSYSLVGLGAGMNLEAVARAGIAGFGVTLLTIGGTLLVGAVLRRLFRADVEASLLITVGTAICGGSAIAAVAPTIRAKSGSISVALGVVFLLNALALFVFPPLGRALGFDEVQFGVWAALAIHDTSSVVGATLQYGPAALAMGTTVKLARALWIIPLTWLVATWHRRQQPQGDGERGAPAKPWFILGFLACAALFTYSAPLAPWVQDVRSLVELAGRRGLVLSLFLIGLNINLKNLREIGPRPVLLGVVLWLLVASLSAAGVRSGLLF